MKKFPIYLFVITCSFLVGCQTRVDYDYTTNQVVRNALDQSVRLEIFRRGSLLEEVNLDANQEAFFSYTEMSPIPPSFNFSDSVRFTFDDSRVKVDVVNNFDDRTNILLEENHTLEGNTYTYIIDNEDLKEAQ